MGETNMVKVLELSAVSPPPDSVAETYLPLTFFDVSWLQLPSVQRIFFYEFSDPNTTTTTSHFLHFLLPNLKHSLSLALQLFYPLCGNLTLSPQTGFPEIHYVDGDSVSFSAVESAADFHHLAPGRDLEGKDGLATASEAIGRAVEGLREGVLKGAENWIPYFASIANEHIVSVAGSPRFRVYDTDFGWGRPSKTEVVSIDGTGAVYIGDSRDDEGGIEFGLVLPTSEMSVFSSLFEEGLKSDH
ncbi:hypothetical protein AAC387_Pa11g2224 [Persea americana]